MSIELEITELSDSKLFLWESIGKAGENDDIDIWRNIAGTIIGASYKGRRLSVDLMPALQEMINVLVKEQELL